MGLKYLVCGNSSYAIGISDPVLSSWHDDTQS